MFGAVTKHPAHVLTTGQDHRGVPGTTHEFTTTGALADFMKWHAGGGRFSESGAWLVENPDGTAAQYARAHIVKIERGAKVVDTSEARVVLVQDEDDTLYLGDVDDPGSLWQFHDQTSLYPGPHGKFWSCAQRLINGDIHLMSICESVRASYVHGARSTAVASLSGGVTVALNEAGTDALARGRAVGFIGERYFASAIQAGHGHLKAEDNLWTTDPSWEKGNDIDA